MKNSSTELQTSLFLRGEGFFTTLLQTSNGYAFLNRHLSRLAKSCDFFCCADEWAKLEATLLKDLFSENSTNQNEARVRVSFFKINNKLEYHIERSVYERPVDFSLYTSEKRRDERIMPTFFKDHFYLPYTLEKKQRKLKDKCDLLIFDNDSFVCEASMGNIFFRLGEKVVTPNRSKSFYSGITREVLLEVLDELGIELECRDIKIDEIKKSDEIWITSSLKRIMRISEFDDVEMKKDHSMLPEVLRKFVEKERSESREC